VGIGSTGREGSPEGDCYLGGRRGKEVGLEPNRELFDKPKWGGEVWGDLKIFQ